MDGLVRHTFYELDVGDLILSPVFFETTESLDCPGTTT